MIKQFKNIEEAMTIFKDNNKTKEQAKCLLYISLIHFLSNELNDSKKRIQQGQKLANNIKNSGLTHSLTKLLDKVQHQINKQENQNLIINLVSNPFVSKEDNELT